MISKHDERLDFSPSRNPVSCTFLMSEPRSRILQYCDGYDDAMMVLLQILSFNKEEEQTRNMQSQCSFRRETNYHVGLSRSYAGFWSPLSLSLYHIVKGLGIRTFDLQRTDYLKHLCVQKQLLNT